MERSTLRTFQAAGAKPARIERVIPTSAGRLCITVFSRVSQALSQFVKPIASSQTAATSTSSSLFERATFQREGDQKEQPAHKEKEEVLAKIIRLPEPMPPASPQASVSVPQVFVLLFREFRQRRHDVLKRIGKRVYSASNGGRPRGYRKGAMLDKKAE